MKKNVWSMIEVCQTQDHLINNESMRKNYCNFITYFKSANKMEKNSTSSINIQKLWKSAMLQFKLENSGHELIFMDEFSISSRYNKHYTWSKVSEKRYVKIIIW